jgi:site-specific recombinase XerD
MDANEQHLAAYERSLKAKNRSPRTVQGYLEALGQLARHAETDDITTIDQAAIERWMQHVIEAPKRRKIHGHAGSTAAIRFRQVRAFYSWCVREEIIDRSPMKRMTEPSTVDVPVPVVADDTIRAILKTCAGTTFTTGDN